MFGGQSHPDFDNDLAAFVGPTRVEIRKELEELGLSQEQIEAVIDQKLKKTISQAMQELFIT